ncbi:hypothetical protein L6773_20100, partial [Rhodohalobacter sp. WB101]
MVFEKYSQYVLNILITLLLITLTLPSLNAQPQEIAEFTVHAGTHDRWNTPVSISLSNLPIGVQSGQTLQLYEVKEGRELAVKSQLDANGYDHSLRWILSGNTPPGTSRTYILKKEADNGSEDDQTSVTVTDSGEDLTLRIDGKNVLSYRHAVTSPPEGV